MPLQAEIVAEQAPREVATNGSATAGLIAPQARGAVVPPAGPGLTRIRRDFSLASRRREVLIAMASGRRSSVHLAREELTVRAREIHVTTNVMRAPMRRGRGLKVAAQQILGTMRGSAGRFHKRRARLDRTRMPRGSISATTAVLVTRTRIKRAPMPKLATLVGKVFSGRNLAIESAHLAR